MTKREFDLNNLPPRVPPKVAAEYMGLSPATLAQWRCYHTPGTPQWVVSGPRRIMYDVAALDAYLNGRTHAPADTPRPPIKAQPPRLNPPHPKAVIPTRPCGRRVTVRSVADAKLKAAAAGIAQK